MKHLKRFNEGVGIVNINSNPDIDRMPNLQHRGDNLESGKNISIFEQDWFEKLLPDTLEVQSCPMIKKINFDQSLSDLNTENRIYTLVKNDCTIDSDLIQFNYYQNTFDKPEDVINDGEPDLLEFDIHFVKNESGIKLLVDITYGDNMAYEFSLETPNKINVIHYTGKGSLHDSETHWGFTEKSIGDIVKFFNAFNHGIKVDNDDFNFLDSSEDSYKYDNKNKQQLYSDDSNLLKFGNSTKESIKKFKNF